MFKLREFSWKRSIPPSATLSLLHLNGRPRADARSLLISYNVTIF
jgi:hypothetical protein